MSQIKIIIPMAGLGKRLGGLTRYKPKALVRIAEKRLLDHVLDSFQQLEKTFTLEYIFIVGYRGDQIRDHMQAAHPDKKVTYFVQEELRGQSHAILLARDVISGPLLITYCDTINEIDFSFLPLHPLEGMASVREVDDPRRHGVALPGPDGYIARLLEKPGTMDHRSALTGVYYLPEGRELIKAIEVQIQSGISIKNEYYLADAVNILLNSGLRLRAETVSQWLDAGTPEAMIETNACLLEGGARTESDRPMGNSNQLIHPVFIHKSSLVENCIIGPNVTIGENCTVSGSILSNTIIDDDSQVRGAILEHSLIGQGCFVQGKAVQVVTADHAELKILSSGEETAAGPTHGG